MNFPFFIVKKIAFSKEQSFSRFIIKIAVGAVAMSMTVMIVATALVNGFQSTISEKVFGFWAHVIVSPYDATNSLAEIPISKDRYIYSNVSDFEEIEHIQVTALKGGIMHAEEDFDGIVLKGIGDDFKWDYLEEYMVEGTPFEVTGAKDNPGILISQETANRLQLEMEENVLVSFFDDEGQVRKRKFQISGIFNSGISEFDKIYAIVDIGVIQYLNDWDDDMVGGFEIFVGEEHLFNSKFKTYFTTVFGKLMPMEMYYKWSEEPLDKVGNDIYYSIDSDLYAQTIKEFRPDIFNWLSLQTMNEVVILFIMILVAAFNMITALLILILERTNMIGILKALGANDRQLNRVFLINGAMIIVVGLLIGNLLGLGLCWLQDVTHIIKLPEDSYYISYTPVRIDYMWVLFLNVFTLITSVLFLMLPAILVSKITPVKAIRFS